MKKVYKMTDYPKAPWTKGVYDVEIPDYPHELGSAFTNIAPHATTWFRASHPDGNRYLHTGGRSLGCITLIEKERFRPWEDFYFLA